MKYQLIFLLLVPFQTVLAQFQPIEIVQQALVNIEQNYYDTTYHNVKDWNAVKQEAVHMVKNGSSASSAIDTILARIGDPNLRCLSQNQFNTLYKELTAQRQIGVGLQELVGLSALDEELPLMQVITPLYNSPAYKAGILASDLILEINGDGFENKSTHEAINLLRGEVGDTIRISVATHPQHRTFKDYTLIIEEYQPPIHPFYQIIKYQRKKIGMIWIPQFTSGTSMRVLQILNELKKRKVDGLVLDLRHNYGGLLNEAQSTAGLFIGQRPMLFTQSKNSATKMIASTTTKQFDEPMVVLMDRGTASSAEALASILKYEKRAKLVGDETAKRGLIYSFFTLNDMSTLIIPVGRMVSLDHQDIEDKGVYVDEFLMSEQQFALHKSYKKDKLLVHSLKVLMSEL